jgi:hypothetical protein
VLARNSECSLCDWDYTVHSGVLEMLLDGIFRGCSEQICLSAITSGMLPDAIEKHYWWRIFNVCYRRRDGPWLHSRGTMMFLEATTAAHRPAPELQLPLAGGIPRRGRPTPQAYTIPTPPAQQPTRHSPAPSPRRLRSSLAPWRQPRSCPAQPREDCRRKRENRREGLRERERRGYGIKIRKKEEKG